ncbi:AAA-ATPase At2g46620-like isoform X2 [Salvia hispanica]|uniref:AAA-ATPase At2g46620-like isoform X2 n=1 Tax=Salvia hispanica TaxID=49212 RepID=UPI0020098AA5|nr:AAA-ATPase At2g46620-like isoform X2 [Salvia hispanica]
MFSFVNFGILILSIVFLVVVSKFLSTTSLIHSLKKVWRWLQEKCYVYQFYKVPKFNENMQENQLYRKVSTYLNSLPSVEDSDFANLFAGTKPTEINLVLDENQTVTDQFLGARVFWRSENGEREGEKSLVLKIRKNDKRRVLVQYLQHIHQTFDEIEQKLKEVRLFVNVDDGTERNGRWRSTSFTHPATMETMVMDADLLYGAAGTGKSTFIAAMAKFLSYDVYEINLHKVRNDADLKYLLLQTTKKSLLVIEDLDRHLEDKSTALSLSGVLNFMDGIFSSCGEERVMVFTMNSKENVCASILRPGRIDVHINFPLCDFSAFKNLANSHLGLKEHKLFPQVEEIFQTGATLSQAEIGEIMISNRGSPSRALKTVITALQGNLASRVGKRLSGSRSGSGRTQEEAEEAVKEGQNGILHPMKDIKNFYGLLRNRSSRKASMDKFEIDLNDRENSAHGA